MYTFVRLRPDTDYEIKMKNLYNKMEQEKRDRENEPYGVSYESPSKPNYEHMGCGYMGLEHRYSSKSESEIDYFAIFYLRNHKTGDESLCSGVFRVNKENESVYGVLTEKISENYPNNEVRIVESTETKSGLGQKEHEIMNSMLRALDDIKRRNRQVYPIRKMSW